MTEAAESWPPMRPMSEAPRTGVEILAGLFAKSWGPGFVLVHLCIPGTWREGDGTRWRADELAGWWPLPIVGPGQEGDGTGG